MDLFFYYNCIFADVYICVCFHTSWWRRICTWLVWGEAVIWISSTETHWHLSPSMIIHSEILVEVSVTFPPTVYVRTPLWVMEGQWIGGVVTGLHWQAGGRKRTSFVANGWLFQSDEDQNRLIPSEWRFLNVTFLCASLGVSRTDREKTPSSRHILNSSSDVT